MTNSCDHALAHDFGRVVCPECGSNLGPASKGLYVWDIDCPSCGRHQLATTHDRDVTHCDRCPDKGTRTRLGGPYDVDVEWEAFRAFDAERAAEMRLDLENTERSRDLWRKEHRRIKHDREEGDQQKAWEMYTMYRDSAKELKILLGGS